MLLSIHIGIGLLLYGYLLYTTEFFNKRIVVAASFFFMIVLFWQIFLYLWIREATRYKNRKRPRNKNQSIK
jgi:hypothetical protein